jgi:hypothetical protein
MTGDAVDDLRRQICMEDVSEVLGATRGLAAFGVAFSLIDSDDPDERRMAVHALVGAYENEIATLQREIADLRRPSRLRWKLWRSARK